MYIIRARFETTVASPETPPSSFPRLVRDSIQEGDHIEHWHTAVHDGSVDVTLFVLRPTQVDVDELAMEICVRFIANTGGLQQWQLSQCTVNLIGPMPDIYLDEPG